MQRVARAFISHAAHRIKAFVIFAAFACLILGRNTTRARPVRLYTFNLNTIAHALSTKLRTIASAIQSAHFAYQIAAALAIILTRALRIVEKISARFDSAEFVPNLLRVLTLAFAALTRKSHCNLTMMIIVLAFGTMKTLWHAL